MAFLSFPYSWCIRVSPIQGLSINSNIFYLYLKFIIFSTLSVDSESEVRIQFNLRLDCQFLHFTSISDEFLVQSQTTNAKKLLLRTPLQFSKTLSKNWGVFWFSFFARPPVKFTYLSFTSSVIYHDNLLFLHVF